MRKIFFGVGGALVLLVAFALFSPQATVARGVHWVDSPGVFQVAQAIPPGAPPPTGAGCAGTGMAAPTSFWQDPSTSIQNVSTGWLNPATGFASALFKTLFIFEIFMVGLQAILFRDNIMHLFSTYTFKVFVACFFIYLMANAATIFAPILASFQIAGQTLGQSSVQSLFTIFAQGTSAAALFFCAAMASHIQDMTAGNGCGAFTAGTGNVGCAITESLGHLTFEFFSQGLGMVIIGAMGIMFLSYALITAEMFIAMTAGALFLGLSSTRFTLPFTQGYLGYMLNVGVKQFTFWVLVAVEQIFLVPQLLSAGVGLIGAANVPHGTGAEMFLVPATVSVVQILATAALTWFLPTITGRFISGESPVWRVP
jgi:hypothetical protein